MTQTTVRMLHEENAFFEYCASLDLPVPVLV